MLRPDESGNPICTLCGKPAVEHTVDDARKCFPQQVLGSEKEGIVLCGPVIDTTNIRHSKE
jgi:hypothetical protein